MADIISITCPLSAAVHLLRLCYRCSQHKLKSCVSNAVKPFSSQQEAGPLYQSNRSGHVIWTSGVSVYGISYKTAWAWVLSTSVVPWHVWSSTHTKWAQWLAATWLLTTSSALIPTIGTAWVHMFTISEAWFWPWAAAVICCCKGMFCQF